MKEKRIVAFLIDYLLIVFTMSFLALILILFQQILNPKEELILGLIIMPFIFIAYVYLFFRDVIWRGQSFGKRFVKIKMVDKNMMRLGIVRLLLYDVTVLIWPIEAIILMTKGWTIGEYFADVQFIEV